MGLEKLIRQRIYKEKPITIKSILEMLLLVYVVLLVVLLYFVMFISVLVVVKGQSMENSLHNNELVLINRFSKNPKMNDIVVLKNPNTDIEIIKRVVALSGDTIVFKAEDSFVKLWRKSGNGVLKEIEETFIKERMLLSFFERVDVTINIDEERTIEQGFIFVMGDNRNDSLDSRIFGQVAKNDIRGIQYTLLKKDSALEWLFIIIYRPKF
ncbi:MAG: signal peptidase I [Clostridiales bacterium]|jgi:signal peptidase I|nr:signal peptidase I [Clostridiales bacterium]